MRDDDKYQRIANRYLEGLKESLRQTWKEREEICVRILLENFGPRRMTSDELVTAYYSLLRFGGHIEAIERFKADLKVLEQEAYQRGVQSATGGYSVYDF